MTIKWILRDLYRYIFRYVPWVIIGFLLTFIIPSCEVNALTQLAMPWDATYPCDSNNSCYGPNTYNSYSTTYKGGLKYYSRDTLTSAKWNSITYYWNDAVFNNMDYAVVQFTYSLNNYIEQKEYSASVNGVTCQNSIYTPPVVNGSITTSASITYECKHVPVTSKYNGYDIGITLLAEPINNFSLFWISTPVVYEDTDELIVDKQDETNNKLDDLNDNITSSATDNNNVSNTLNNINIGNQGVITKLITMPITLFNNVLNSINGTCTTFQLGNLFGTNLSMPCINLENILGSNLWSIIDILLSGFLAWGISKKIKMVFEQLTNLREGDILSD